MSALIDTGQIAQFLGVARETAASYTRKPGFPAPAVAGRWERNAVLRWFLPSCDDAELAAIELPTAEEAAQAGMRVRLAQRTMRDHVAMAVRNARRRSIAKDWPFLMSVGQVQEIYIRQGGVCAVSGAAFSLDRPIDGAPAPFSPSLDRIDNRIGYEPSNVRLVCYCINLLMNVWGESVYASLRSHITGQRAA